MVYHENSKKIEFRLIFIDQYEFGVLVSQNERFLDFMNEKQGKHVTKMRLHFCFMIFSVESHSREKPKASVESRESDESNGICQHAPEFNLVDFWVQQYFRKDPISLALVSPGLDGLNQMRYHLKAQNLNYMFRYFSWYRNRFCHQKAIFDWISSVFAFKMCKKSDISLTFLWLLKGIMTQARKLISMKSFVGLVYFHENQKLSWKSWEEPVGNSQQLFLLLQVHTL